MMPWPWNHAWTQSHHLMKALFEAMLLYKQQSFYDNYIFYCTVSSLLPNSSFLFLFFSIYFRFFIMLLFINLWELRPILFKRKKKITNSFCLNIVKTFEPVNFDNLFNILSWPAGVNTVDVVDRKIDNTGVITEMSSCPRVLCISGCWDSCIRPGMISTRWLPKCHPKCPQVLWIRWMLKQVHPVEDLALICGRGWIRWWWQMRTPTELGSGK